MGKTDSIGWFDSFPNSSQISEVSNTLVGESIIVSLAQKGISTGFCGVYKLEKINKLEG